MPTEGLSDKRLACITRAVEKFPQARLGRFVETMLQNIDEPYGDDNDIPGAVFEKRVGILCGMILKAWEYGVQDGEDRAISRLTAVMKGERT